MSKAKMNYLLDAVIALAFVLSAVTGLAFMAMGSGGFQGGRNAGFETVFLGVSRTAWSDLHTWGSLIMIAGVVIHLVLHWQWIVCMTKKMVRRPKPRREEEQCPVTL
jgi:cytochrome b subunit of formate dehydrogenase